MLKKTNGKKKFKLNKNTSKTENLITFLRSKKKMVKLMLQTLKNLEKYYLAKIEKNRQLIIKKKKRRNKKIIFFTPLPSL